MQLLARLWDSLSTIAEAISTKPAVMAIGAFLSSFFMPMLPIMALCLVTTAVDMFYGIRVAVKFGRTGSCGSAMWKGAIIKLRDVLVILTLAHGVEKYMISPILDVNVTMLGAGAALIVAITEIWSILENMHTLHPDGPWKSLGKFMRDKSAKYLDMNLEDLNLKDKDDEHKQDS